jgi:hypothetical protein
MSTMRAIPIWLARGLAILWLANLITMLLLGGAQAIAQSYRDRAASVSPTNVNTASFVEHGQMRFAPQKILTTIHRINVTAFVMFCTLLALTVAAAAATFSSDAVGRRWGRWRASSR